MRAMSVVMAVAVLAACRGQAEEPEAPAAPAPILFAPAPAGTNGAGRPMPFAPEISAEFIKKVMETSARIQKAKGRIADREAELYASHDEIRAIRAQMVERQTEINRILDADPELAELKMSRDLLWSTMPAVPRMPMPPAALPAP